eukprot:COSAG05_NODE_70_length_22091_cov_108.202164_6_plen_400_part_00
MRVRQLPMVLALAAVIWLSWKTFNYIDALQAQLEHKQLEINLLKFRATGHFEGTGKKIQGSGHHYGIRQQPGSPPQANPPSPAAATGANGSGQDKGNGGGSSDSGDAGAKTVHGDSMPPAVVGVPPGVNSPPGVSPPHRDRIGQQPGPPPKAPPPSPAQAPQRNCGPDFSGSKCNCVGTSQYCSVAGICGDSQEYRNSLIEYDCRPPMGHAFDDPNLLSFDRRVQLVYATTFYTEHRKWPDKMTICPVGNHNIIVTETYNTSLAAKADGLIYYGPDLYHTNLPPFGDGTKYGTAPSYPVLFIRNCVSFLRRAFVCLSDFYPVSYGAIYCPCAAEMSLHGAMNHYQYRCLTIESHARTGRCRSGSQRSHRRALEWVHAVRQYTVIVAQRHSQHHNTVAAD